MISMLALLMNPSLPEPLAEAMVPAAPAEVSAYDFEIDQGDTTWRAVITPGNPEGERIDVISPAPDDWPKGAEKMIKSFEEEVDGDIWCDGMDEMIGRDIQEVSTSAQAITYSFRPLITEDSDKTDKKFAEVALGEVDIVRPVATAPWRITAVRMTIDKPFKPMMVAKLNSFDLNITCAQSASGRMYQAESTSHAQGSAMGKKFDQRERTKISNVRLKN